MITMDYTKIETTFIPRDANNQLGSPLRTGFDLIHAESM
jgi:hypothetical protein